MRFILIVCFLFPLIGTVRAQSHESQQLLLNYEKLKQLKNILTDMKEGYEIIDKGYNSVKNIAEGNFNLHETFLNGLMSINPVIKNYWRVAKIVEFQKSLVGEYKSAFGTFSKSNLFNVNELNYLKHVYQNVLDASVSNLEELLIVTTSNKLSMNDNERLQNIDRLYDDSLNSIQFMKDFNQKTLVLMMQRKQDVQNLKQLQKLYQP